MRNGLNVLCVLMYPAICGPVAWIAYKYLFVENGPVGGAIEIILSIGTVLGAAAVAGVLAFCINISLHSAAEASYKLDDLFIIFDDLFKSYETTDKEESQESESYHEFCYNDYYDNLMWTPYYGHRAHEH